MDFVFNLNKKQLKNVEAFIRKNHSVKIGVLGSSKNEHDGISAVELAAVHEFGIPGKMPQRSFLRTTLDNYDGVFKIDMAAARDRISDQIASGRYMQFLNEVGSKWVGYVHKTFDVEGPGWQEHSPSYRAYLERYHSKPARGKEDMEPTWPILRRTGAMLRSITHEVVSD